MKLREAKRKNGTSTFFIDYRLDGARRRVRLAGIHDRQTAKIAFAEFQVRLAKGQAGLATNEGLSLSSCLRAHIDARKAVCKPKHVSLLEVWKAQMEGHFGANTPAKNLSEKTVNDWRAELRQAGDCASTINRKANLIKAAIAKAVKDGKLAKNPLENMECLSDARREVWRWLRDDEISALLGVLRDGLEIEVKRGNGRDYKTVAGRNQELWRLVIFLLNTGARCGEALAVRWADVDFRRGIVTLHTTKAASKGRKAKPRHIPMNAALRELLEGMEPGEGPLFHYPNNRNRDFDRVCELAGIGHVRIHDLRHTFASHLVMAGVPLNTVRELLGHATLAMTLRYAHLAPEATAKAVETLNFGASGQGAKIVSVGEKAG